MLMRIYPDDAIRSGLWNFEPEHRPLVIHERRVRFGVDDDFGDNNQGGE